MKLYDGYLTEEKLGRVLEVLLPEGEWVHNKTTPLTSRNYRPDYRNEYYKLIVEYNGHLHYTVAKTVLEDYEKIEELTELGYRVVWVPYWLQLNNPAIIMAMFPQCSYDLSTVEFTDFPQGFISEKCVLPADFCSLGLFRFSYELSDHHPFINEVMCSLEQKKLELGEARVNPLGIGCVCEYLNYKDKNN